MKRKSVVFENEYVRVEVYGPPKEHGDAHVHVFGRQYKRKRDNPHLKIFIGERRYQFIEMKSTYKFKKETIKAIIFYVSANREKFLKEWEDRHGKKEEKREKKVSKKRK